MTRITEAWNSLAAAHQQTLAAQLESDETVLAWLAPDLDQRLRYVPGLVVLTDRRLLAQQPPASPANGSGWQAWPLTADVSLRSADHAGIGTLELLGPDGRRAHWRYTAGVASAARNLVQCWDMTRNGTALPAKSVCPSCGAEMAATDDQCPACAADSKPPTLSSLTRLVAFARPRAAMIALGFLLTLASTSAGLVPPYLTMPLLDRVLIPHQNGQPVDFALVGWYLAGLFGAAILAWLLEWAQSYVSSWVSERISADLRDRTYAHLQTLSLEFFGGKRTGDLMSRVSSDTDRICNFLSSQLVGFITDVLMIVMTAAVLLWIDAWLALVTLCPFPLIIWLLNHVNARQRRGYRQSIVAWADMNSVLADTIPGIRVVKAFAQERREIERFGTSNERVLHVNDRLNVVWAFFGPVVTLLTTLGLLMVWAFAAWRVYNSLITVGVLTAFLAYITRFYARSESLIRFVWHVQRAAASAQRIFEILDRQPSVPEPAQPVDPGRLQGRIELDGVRFKYGTREVLHGIDLKIEPGEMIGLVGPSGAGKTTLTNLICRFFDVAEGAIRVDGTDVRSFPVEAYRRNIGIVLQDPFLFYGTIAENIAYGRPGASREDIVAAARAARAHEFILKLPDGYDSLVGERGQSLSGGERQRISIARALLIDPRILILDEATSSVDTETERAIQAALETLIQGRTTIAIAHRLSTLRRADRIVVVDQGRIVEVGSHHELLRAKGMYSRLHRAQIEMVQGHAV